MKRLSNDGVKFVIHRVVAVDDSDFIRVVGHKLAQEEMHLLALKALIIGKLRDLEHRVF